MRKIIFISVLLVAGCKINNDLTGTWKSGNYSISDRMFAILLNRNLGFGDVLELRPDSSWKLAGTCEVIEGRRWAVVADSLCLYPDTIWGVYNKSLNHSASFFNGGYLTYDIKRHRLVKSSIGYYMSIDKNDSLIRHRFKKFEKLEPSK